MVRAEYLCSGMKNEAVAKTVFSVQEKARRDSDQCIWIPERSMWRRLSQALSCGIQWQDKKQWAQIETREVPFECQKTPSHCEADQVLAQVAQSGDEVSICGDDSQKPTGHCLGQPVLGVSAWAWGWTRWPSKIPSKLNCSVILWKWLKLFWCQGCKYSLSKGWSDKKQSD